jgi:phage tail-like protein
MKQTGIEQLLPEIMRRTLGAGKPMDAILGVMEDLHAPAEASLERIEQFFNPYTTPARFVPYLASWLDLERFFDVAGSEPVSSGGGRVRELIARAAWLSQWRGTARGLLAFLETATGATGFTIDEHAQQRAFHISVHVPAALAAHQALIARIVDSEKPAYVTAEIHYDPEENRDVPRV